MARESSTSVIAFRSSVAEEGLAARILASASAFRLLRVIGSPRRGGIPRCGPLGVGAAQDLALWLGEESEGDREGVAAIERLGGIGPPRDCAGLVRQAQIEVVAATGRPILVGDDVSGDRIQPGQGGIGNAVAPAPGDREGVCDRVLGNLPTADAPHREGEQLRVVVAKAALEAVAVDVWDRGRRIVHWKHLRVDVRPGTVVTEGVRAATLAS
jgi:hypothetical protein